MPLRCRVALTSIRNGERLDEIGTTPQIGVRGDSYDSAMADTLNAFYEAELTCGPTRPQRLALASCARTRTDQTLVTT